MNGADAWLRKIADQYPSVLETKDLIEIGLYKTNQSASQARKRGIAPPFFDNEGRGYIYPKEALIEWLKNRKQSHERQKKKGPYSKHRIGGL